MPAWATFVGFVLFCFSALFFCLPCCVLVSKTPGNMSALLTGTLLFQAGIKHPLISFFTSTWEGLQFPVFTNFCYAKQYFFPPESQARILPSILIFLPTVTVGAAPQWSAIKTEPFVFRSMYVVKGDCSATVQQIWQAEIPFFAHSSQYCILGHNSFASWALYMFWDLLFLLLLLGRCCLCFCFLSSLLTWFLILFLFPCLL